MSAVQFEDLTGLAYERMPRLAELNGTKIVEVGHASFIMKKQMVIDVAIACKDGVIYRCNLSMMPMEWRITVLAKLVAMLDKEQLKASLGHGLNPKDALLSYIDAMLKEYPNDAIRKQLNTQPLPARAYSFVVGWHQSFVFVEDPGFFCAFKDWPMLPTKQVESSASSINEPPVKRPKLSLTVGGKGGEHPPLLKEAFAVLQENETLKAEKAEKQRAIEELQAENQRMKQKLDEQVVHASNMQQFLDNILQQGMQFSSKKNAQAPPAAP